MKTIWIPGKPTLLLIWQILIWKKNSFSKEKINSVTIESMPAKHLRPTSLLEHSNGEFSFNG